jgi:hypothetical protein
VKSRQHSIVASARSMRSPREKQKGMSIKGLKRRGCTIVGVILLLILASLLTNAVAEEPVAQKNPYLVRTLIDKEGRQIDEIIVPGRPPAIKAEAVAVPEPHIAMGINNLANVPAFDWSYGCSATSGAMMAGYYDRTGYPNVYTGSTNGGVCPVDNSVWGHTWWVDEWWSECPLSATHQGKDGRGTRGHVDDYWVDYGSTAQDPFITNGWPEHTYGDCTGDYMKTNQYNYGNSDGSTTFWFFTSGSAMHYYDLEAIGYNNYDGGYGLKLFFESRGYSVTDMYNQYIKGQGSIPSRGFTFDQYKAEIDAGRPVMIHVEGHSMLGFGYNDSSNLVYLHDTWDYSDHTMTWGGSYYGMQHYGVTVLQLKALPEITSCNSGGTEINAFAPGENVSVKGSGLEPNTPYKIWIQDNPVSEGDLLNMTEDDSGSQEIVTTDGSGNFGPMEIWAIPGGASITHHEYDIIVDKQSDVNTGIYNAASDGIDSATAVGITAPVPELPTIFLFSVGLLTLAGYVLWKKKRP